MLEIGKGEEPATSDEKVLPEIDEKSEEMKTTDKSGESEQQVKDQIRFYIVIHSTYQLRFPNITF